MAADKLLPPGAQPTTTAPTTPLETLTMADPSPDAWQLGLWFPDDMAVHVFGKPISNTAAGRAAAAEQMEIYLARRDTDSKASPCFIPVTFVSEPDFDLIAGLNQTLAAADPAPEACSGSPWSLTTHRGSCWRRCERSTARSRSRTRSPTFSWASVSSAWSAMDLFIEDDRWVNRYADKTPREISAELMRLVEHIDLRKIKKHPRGKKKPAPKRT